MIFGETPVAEALGAILAHSRIVGGLRWPKGRVLGADDLAVAMAEGIERLVVARPEPGDVPEAEAAGRLGTALAGDGVAARAPVNGRVNLTAADDGLLLCDAAAVDSVNAVDEGMTIGTLAPYARVRAGDVVATIKIIPYAVPRLALDKAVELAATPSHPERSRGTGGSGLLSVARFRREPATLIQTRLPHQPDKLLAKTVDVTRLRLEALGGALVDGGDCPHDVDSLAKRLRGFDTPLILVAAASATVDRRDVVPAAIAEAGGVVVRVGMPVDPGNMLCLGRIGGSVVVGLPGCARSPRRNGLDLVLERLAAGIDVDSAAIAAMGAGGLLPDGDRPDPREKPLPAVSVVRLTGALVLAAGRSSRMGGPNKLLADLGGKPVLAHVLDAVAGAGLPALVVTGDRAGDVAALAAGTPTVHAADHAEGLGRSLRAGIAAAPDDWQAAIVCLGDMPGITPALLRALAAQASPSAIVVPTFAGRRGNPVLWGRDHFARLRALDGDVGGKALLSEFAARVIEVAADGEAIFADIDTPEALAAARARLG